jgi:hypothetical protein
MLRPEVEDEKIVFQHFQKMLQHFCKMLQHFCKMLTKIVSETNTFQKYCNISEKCWKKPKK